MSDTMTQTPMTDANRFCTVVDNGWYAHEKSTDGTWCTADFAASFETKLAAMTAQRDALREAGDATVCALNGCVMRLRIALAEQCGEVIDIPDAPSRIDNIYAIAEAIAAWSKAKTK